MKIRLDDKEIIKMDAAIKIHVHAKGDYTEPDALLSRLIWNICFNPREKKRSLKIIQTIVTGSEFKDLPTTKGSLPIIK